MQRIAHSTLQPAPIHPVVGLGVADQWLDRLAPLEQALLVIAERLVLAAVDDLHARVVGVHAPVAQVDDDLLGRASQVLQQIGGLLELGAEDVAVVRELPGKLRAPTIKPCLWVTARLTKTANS